MKKYRTEDFWFELTKGPSPDGVGFVRYNSITCRKCGKCTKIHNTGQSVDQMRKFFIRQNWDIGRARNLHLCPDCAVRHKHRPTEPERPRLEPPASNVVPLRPPPQRVTLQEAWEQASESERLAFLILLRRDHAEITPQSEFKPVPPPDSTHNDEPADWWKELNEEVKR